MLSMGELIEIAKARLEANPRDAAEHYFAAGCLGKDQYCAGYAVMILEGLPEEDLTDVSSRNVVLGGVFIPEIMTSDSAFNELVRRGVLPPAPG